MSRGGRVGGRIRREGETSPARLRFHPQGTLREGVAPAAGVAG